MADYTHFDAGTFAKWLFTKIKGLLSGYVKTSDSRLSDARKASDVSAWAKALTKPTYTAAEVGAAAASHNHDSTYLKLSGGTLSGQLFTSFKNAVSVGAYQASATTVPDLLNEVRYSSGCMGSVYLDTAYNGIPAAWYNFLYIPHRSGGISGAAHDDNCDFGTLLLFGMTTANQAWVVEFQLGNILGAFSIRNTDTTYTALKNPNALSITADGKTVTYDGSSAQSISISSGSSKSVASTLLASGWSGSAAPYTYDIGSAYSGKSVAIGYDATKYTESSAEAASDADIVGGEGTVIYAYGEKPSVDIPIIIQCS